MRKKMTKPEKKVKKVMREFKEANSTLGARRKK